MEVVEEAVRVSGDAVEDRFDKTLWEVEVYRMNVDEVEWGRDRVCSAVRDDEVREALLLGVDHACQTRERLRREVIYSYSSLVSRQ